MAIAGLALQAQEPGVSGTETQIVERGPNHAVYRQVFDQPQASGGTVLRTNQFTLLENGLHYLENGQWRESEDLIESFPDGAVARRGPNKAIFSRELNTDAAFDIQASDGARIRGGVRAIQLFNARTGETFLLGKLKESVTAKLLPPNQVLWADAFDGIKADVLVVWKHNLFSHDIMLLEQPTLPAGWDGKDTRLEVVTEFLVSREPERRSSVRREEDQPEVRDDVVIHFGELAMIMGKAHASADDRAYVLGTLSDEGTPVVKQWHATPDGRRFLVESVSWTSALPHLKDLPLARQAGINTNQHSDFVAAAREWPASPSKIVARQPILIASGPYSPHGYLVDFTIVPDSGTPTTLSSTNTYYIKTSYYSGSSVTIEAGAVIKYKNTANMLLYGPVTFPSSGTAVFTSRNDDTIGDLIVGVSGETNSDGNPTSHKASKAIWLYYSSYTTTIRNARIAWATTGILRDRGSYTWTLTVNDCIFQYITGTGSQGINAEAYYLSVSNLKKCNVTTPGATMTTDCVGVENSLTGDSSWQLSTPATAGWPISTNDTTPEIEGFASLTSVNVGGTLGFYVDVRNGSSTFNLKIYRMGWYNGDGARQMRWYDSTDGSVTEVNRTGVKQPIPSMDQYGMIDSLAGGSPWSSSYTLSVPYNWLSGVYLAKLTTSTGGYQSTSSSSSARTRATPTSTSKPASPPIRLTTPGAETLFMLIHTGSGAAVKTAPTLMRVKCHLTDPTREPPAILPLAMALVRENSWFRSTYFRNPLGNTTSSASPKSRPMISPIARASTPTRAGLQANQLRPSFLLVTTNTGPKTCDRTSKRSETNLHPIM